LDFLGIRYVFGKNNFKQFKPLGWAAGQVEVSENPSPRPKWFSVRRAIPEGRSLEDDFLKASKESMDFGKQCFIADPSKAGPYQLREVKDELRTVNGLGVFTKGRGKALIVSSELDYPGWSVVVDRDMKFNIPGKVKPIEQINHSFRGIVLDDGESYAIFKFEPLTFRLGLFFSLLVCGLWMTLGLKRVLA
jgi:hypothetical protein